MAQQNQQEESWPTPARPTARSAPVPRKDEIFDFVIPKDGAEFYSGRMVESGNNDKTTNSTSNQMDCSNSMLEYLFWGAGKGGSGYRNVLYDASAWHPGCPDATQDCISNNNNPSDDGNLGFVLPDSVTIPEGSTITIINTCPCGMLEVFLWERSFRLVSLGDRAVFEMRAGNWKWNDYLSVNHNNSNETIRFDRDRYCVRPEPSQRPTSAPTVRGQTPPVAGIWNPTPADENDYPYNNDNLETKQNIGVFVASILFVAFFVCYLTIWGRKLRLRDDSHHNNSERIFDGDAPVDSERTVRASGGGGVRNNTIVINNNSNSNNRTNNNDDNDDDDDNEKVLSLIIKSMSMEERIGLYRGTFARKQQEMLVDPSWIIAGDTKYHSVGDNTNKNNKNDNKGDKDSSNSLSIESEEEDTNDDDNLASTGHTTMAGTTAGTAPTGHNLLHPYYIDPANNRGGDREGAIAVVPGLCVICLEPMLAGETVVCSEKTSCPHLFHRDCLAKFLAHKTKQQERNPRTHKQLGLANPCPTCRQNFVTLDVLPMAFSSTEV